jgi:hypothetical protein
MNSSVLEIETWISNFLLEIFRDLPRSLCVKAELVPKRGTTGYLHALSNSLFTLILP